MANSIAVRKLGAKWETIRARCRKAAIPAQGTPLDVFARSHLADVPAGDTMAVARALRRKGDILIYLVEGQWRVYRKKPVAVSRAPKKASSLAEAVKAISADVVAYAVEGDKGALARIGRKLALATSKGLQPSALENALEAILAPGLWDDIGLRWRALQRHAEAGADIEGDSPEARVLRYIARQGAKGAGKSGMLQNVRPYMSAKAIASALVALEDQFLIASCTCRPEGIGRMREVYFLAGHGLPTLERNGAFYPVNR